MFSTDTRTIRIAGVVFTILISFITITAYVMISNIDQRVEQGPFPKDLTPVETRQETDYSDWKTYRNEEYGFEIRHPHNWKQTSLTIDYRNQKVTRFTKPESTIDITIQEYQANEPLTKQWWLNYIFWQPDEKELNHYTFKEDLFLGYPALWLTESDLFFIKDDLLFHIFLSFSDPQDKKQLTQEFNQILSTFEFIEPSEKYSCNSDNDCTKYISCNEECVNRIWAEENPPAIAPGATCAVPWEYGCSCVSGKCEVGDKLE